MQISVRAKVDGAKVLAAALHPSELEHVLVAALRKAVGPVVEKIRAAAPVGSSSLSKGHLAGQLRRSFRLNISQRRGLSVKISAAPHAHLVEDGHRIVVGGRASRAGRRSTARNTGKVVGQVQAHPFIKPTIDAMLPEVEATIGKEIDKHLDQAARLAKVTGR